MLEFIYLKFQKNKTEHANIKTVNSSIAAPPQPQQKQRQQTYEYELEKKIKIHYAKDLNGAKAIKMARGTCQTRKRH